LSAERIDEEMGLSKVAIAVLFNGGERV